MHCTKTKKKKHRVNKKSDVRVIRKQVKTIDATIIILIIKKINE